MIAGKSGWGELRVVRRTDDGAVAEYAEESEEVLDNVCVAGGGGSHGGRHVVHVGPVQNFSGTTVRGNAGSTARKVASVGEISKP
jgi:hypothetical protein